MLDLDADDVAVVLMLLAGRVEFTLVGEAFFGGDSLLVLEGVSLGRFTVSAL